jgi:D-Tyr-tRNAtyr deacylase
MITIIQRVTQAKVVVDNQTIGEINQGIMALLAIEKEDTEKRGKNVFLNVYSIIVFLQIVTIK